MTWAHAVAAVIEDAADQQCLGLHPRGLVIVQLFTQLSLNGVEQAPIHDGGLLAGQDLPFEVHLPDIETIAKHMRQHPAPERNAADGASRPERPDLGCEATL